MLCPGCWARRNRFSGNGYRALIRDNFQCQNCGVSDSIKRLDIHHIDGQGSGLRAAEQNNTLDNLISLCRLCHKHADDERRGHRNFSQIRDGGKWSIKHPFCIQCGKTTSIHASHGVCLRCYEATRAPYKAEFYRNNYSLTAKQK